MRISRSAVIAAAVIVTVTACSSSGNRAGSPKGSASATVTNAASSPAELTTQFGCVGLPPGTPVSFPSENGDALGLLAKGTQPKVVIFANMLDGTVCDWKTLADKVHADGATVLTIEGDQGEVEKMAAGADMLSTQIPDADIYLVGASMGGASVIIAGSQIPHVKSIVALSPVMTNFESYLVSNFTPKVAAPTLVVVGTGDEGDAATDAPQIAHQIKGARLVQLDTADHGTALLTGGFADQVNPLVQQYLNK